MPQPPPQDLQQSALVPAWFRELCPSATHLDLVRTRLPAALAPYPAPLPQHSLQTLFWDPVPTLDTSAGPIRRHVRQQLAALPSLTSLTVRDLDWAAGAALISGSLTRLVVVFSQEERESPPLVHLPAQFPNLRELDGLNVLIVRDVDLCALLRMPHLRTLKAAGVALQDSHRGRPWPQHLDLQLHSVVVDSFDLLPLDRIHMCAVADSVVIPSEDVACAERVAAACRRWGASCVQQDKSIVLRFMSRDFAATLTSLPPFLRATQPQPITLSIALAVDLTRAEMRRLVGRLTPNVRTLRFSDTSFAAALWPRLLPSLPPSVKALHLVTDSSASALMMGRPLLPSVEQLRSLCQGAVRPIEVRVAGPGAQALVQRALATMGSGAQGRLARLEAADKL